MALGVILDRVQVFVKHDSKSSAWHVVNQFKGLTSRVLRQEFPDLRSKLPTLWSSYLMASAGVVSAETAQRCIDTQSECPWKMAQEDGS